MVDVDALREMITGDPDVARRERVGMWRYGDIDEDDAPEFGARPAAAGAWGKK